MCVYLPLAFDATVHAALGARRSNQQNYIVLCVSTDCSGLYIYIYDKNLQDVTMMLL